jgi:hypothetical protein
MIRRVFLQEKWHSDYHCVECPFHYVEITTIFYNFKVQHTTVLPRVYTNLVVLFLLSTSSTRSAPSTHVTCSFKFALVKQRDIEIPGGETWGDETWGDDGYCRVARPSSIKKGRLNRHLIFATYVPIPWWWHNWFDWFYGVCDLGSHSHRCIKFLFVWFTSRIQDKLLDVFS